MLYKANVLHHYVDDLPLSEQDDKSSGYLLRISAIRSCPMMILSRKHVSCGFLYSFVRLCILPLSGVRMYRAIGLYF